MAAPKVIVCRRDFVNVLYNVIAPAHFYPNYSVFRIEISSFASMASTFRIIKYLC
jgi:hypothetical protein